MAGSDTGCGDNGAEETTSEADLVLLDMLVRGKTASDYKAKCVL